MELWLHTHKQTPNVRKQPKVIYKSISEKLFEDTGKRVFVFVLMVPHIKDKFLK